MAASFSIATSDTPVVSDALELLRRDIPELVRHLALSDIPDTAAWSAIIENKLIPRLQPDVPLLAAICGGGSSGKSSLFNALVGEAVSPVGGMAGMNRRVLLAGRSAYLSRQDVLPALFEPFGCVPAQLNDPADLTVPGPPLYVSADRLPEKLAVMDTPDFDTGAQGAYTNRQAARQALEAADVIIYIFTNANYSNRDNTDFIRQMLTGIGRRKCFLIYRAYPSFTPQEVHDHAMTVARNIYGAAAESNLLGIYRADEDNAVAAGRRLMTLAPLRPEDPPFAQALATIDTVRLRMTLNASILEDTLAIAGAVLSAAKISSLALRLYTDALRAVQNRCTRRALRHFPTDLMLRRFVDIWLASDPVHIRWMRKTGAVLEWPVKALAGAIGQVRRTGDGGSHRRPAADFAERVKEDLIAAANDLYTRLAEPELAASVDSGHPAAADMTQAARRIQSAAPAGPLADLSVAEPDAQGNTRYGVPVHPALAAARQQSEPPDWQTTLQAILSAKGVVTDVSDRVETELKALAVDFRRRMGLWDKLRQSFAAALNVLPATAAVTYVLHTGDPVGAAGIKVKLTGLFGLQDLYALIAIPATSGMKKADRKQLEALIAPIARTWLQNKVQAVDRLFEQEITGATFQTASRVLDRSEALTSRVSAQLDRIAAAVRPSAGTA